MDYALPMKLHTYCRSSASYRVRSALELKGLACEYFAVHIAKGDLKKEPYAARSADELVPLLEVDDERLSQPIANVEYLDAKDPTTALLPAGAMGRAKVPAIAQSMACEVHPVNDLRILKYLNKKLKVSDQANNVWHRHRSRESLQAFEKQLAQLPLPTYWLARRKITLNKGT